MEMAKTKSSRVQIISIKNTKFYDFLGENKMSYVEHTFNPIYNKNSQVLVLGSLPSVKSREYGFYYGHKQNRFWKLIAFITQTEPTPASIEDKTLMLIKNKIALWDVIHSCDIKGSSDSSIRNVVPSNLRLIIDNSNIKKIYANGSAAYSLYMKYCFKDTKKEIIKLPSTSPANAKYSFEHLVSCWNQILC